MSAHGYRYGAFLSYSRTADGQFARDIQHGLQTFAKPWNQLATRVFRDKSGLSAGAALWPAIRKALDDSGHLILLASPRAASSEWVEKEIRYWLQTKSAATILIAVTAGEIKWSGGNFDRTVTTCLPPAMYGACAEEPAWVDLRAMRARTTVSLRVPEFQDLIADLAAPVHGTPKDELLGDAVNQVRHSRRIAWRISAAMAALVIVAAGVAVYAMHEKAVATQQERLAVARQLVAQANAAGAADPRLEVRLGLAARTLHDDEPARASIVRAMMSSRAAATLVGHTDDVVAAVFAPVGRLLATAGADGVVLLWDLTRTDHPVKLGALPRESAGVVRALTFSPDGQTLLTGAVAEIEVWDVRDPVKPRRGDASFTGFTGQVKAVSFVGNDRAVAAVSASQGVLIWSPGDRSHPKRFGGGGPISATTAAFAPGGAMVAVSSLIGDPTMWDLTDPSKPTGATIKGGGVLPQLAFSPDATTLAIGGLAGKIDLWDVTDRARPVRVGASITRTTRMSTTGLAFSPDGVELAAADLDGFAAVWGIRDRDRPTQLGALLTGHTAGLTSVAFSPDGKTIVTTSADRTAMVWDTADRAQQVRLAALPGHSDAVTSVAFSPNGHLLASGSFDKTVALWDLRDRADPVPLGPMPSGHTEGVTSVAFSADGALLASGGLDEQLILWDIHDPTKPQRVGALRSTTSILSIAFSPAGRTLAIGYLDGTLQLWDVTDPSQPRPLGPPLHGHSESIERIAFAPDGRTLATAGSDGAAILWDLTDPDHPQLGDPITDLNTAVWSVGFSPDSRLLVTAAVNGTILLWNLADRAHPTMLGARLTAHTDSVSAVVFTPDGRTMATAGANGTALWDMTDPARPIRVGLPFLSTGTGAYDLAIAVDGRTMAVGDRAGTIGIWDLSGLNDRRQHALEQACAFAGAGLSRQEWLDYVGDAEYVPTCPT